MGCALMALQKDQLVSTKKRKKFVETSEIMEGVL
jgi:hypothetical protein